MDDIDHYKLEWRKLGSVAVVELATTGLTADIPSLAFGVWTFDLRAVDAQGRESAPASLVWTNSPTFSAILEYSPNLNGPWMFSTNLGSFQMNADATNAFYRVRIEQQ